MPDDFATTQLGSQGQAAGFRGSQAGNDARFQQMNEQDAINRFGASIGMSGIAGAGKLAAFLKTPQGQQAFQAFKAKSMLQARPGMGAPAPRPTPTPTPQPGAPQMAPPDQPPPQKISQLAPQPPQAMAQPPQMGGNLGVNVRNPYIQNFGRG